MTTLKDHLQAIARTFEHRQTYLCWISGGFLDAAAAVHHEQIKEHFHENIVGRDGITSYVFDRLKEGIPIRDMRAYGFCNQVRKLWLAGAIAYQDTNPGELPDLPDTATLQLMWHVHTSGEQTKEE